MREELLLRVPKPFAMTFDLLDGLGVMPGIGEERRRRVKTVRPDGLPGVEDGAVGGARRAFERPIEHVVGCFAQRGVVADLRGSPHRFAGHERVHRRSTLHGHQPVL